MKELKISIAAIILAAGKSKRMKSKTSKVLHTLAGKPMILRSINNIKAVNPSQIILVANPDNEQELKKNGGSKVDIAVQKEPKGTGDAAMVGLQKVKKGANVILIANGDDSAFYKPETLRRVIKRYKRTKSIQTILTTRLENPNGLGRIIKNKANVLKIVEEKEATNKQKKIKEINAGLYVFDKNWLNNNLSKVKPSSVTNEKYLVDLVNIAVRQKQKVTTYSLKDSNQWHGINTKEELKAANEKFSKKIHIMGIAGAGASAIAPIAKSFGYDVSGCDLDPHPSYVKSLNQSIFKGHHPSHIHNIGMLVISPAVIKNDPKNSEVIEAKKRDIPILTWQEFQGKFLQNKKYVISIAGGYGKSTTTAMLSKILFDLNLDPTCEIGATLLGWHKNYRVGNSKYYINEADEYNDNFLHYHPDITIVLNLAWDHPDYFKDKKILHTSYKKFINNTKKDGYLVIGSDKELTSLAKLARNDIKVIKIQDFGKVPLSIIGKFRKINADAALTVAKILNLDIVKAKKSVQNFKGVGRRLEFKGKVGGAKVYDDYAVQPYTIKTTANALSQKFPNKKIVLVLEPHTFSRINRFFDELVTNLKNTNVKSIFVTEVFAAREKGDKEKLSKKLASAIGKKAKFTGSIKNTAQYLKNNLNEIDIILSMGAGNVYKLYDFLKD